LSAWENCLWTPNRLEFDSMDEIFRKVITNNFSDLEGLTIAASIPVPEYLVNEIIQSALQGNKDITYCRVTIRRQNRISVSLKTPLLPWVLNLKLRLNESPILGGSPKIKAWLENKVFLARIGSFLKALPAGVSIQGDQVIVDIESFLSTSEQKRILGLVRSVEITTQDGKVILDVKIEAN
jgi:hypothetical protein